MEMSITHVKFLSSVKLTDIHKRPHPFHSGCVYPSVYTIPAVDFPGKPKRHGNECHDQITYCQIYEKMIRDLFSNSFENPKYYDDRDVTGYRQKHHET